MSDHIHIEWHGDEAKKHVKNRAVQFLARAAITVKREAQQLLSVPGKTVEIHEVESTRLTKTRLDKLLAKSGKLYRQAKRSSLVKSGKRLAKTTRKSANRKIKSLNKSITKAFRKRRRGKR